jgi:hypothetical protein
MHLPVRTRIRTEAEEPEVLRCFVPPTRQKPAMALAAGETLRGGFQERPTNAPGCENKRCNTASRYQVAGNRTGKRRSPYDDNPKDKEAGSGEDDLGRVANAGRRGQDIEGFQVDALGLESATEPQVPMSAVHKGWKKHSLQGGGN